MSATEPPIDPESAIYHLQQADDHLIDTDINDTNCRDIAALAQAHAITAIAIMLHSGDLVGPLHELLIEHLLNEPTT